MLKSLSSSLVTEPQSLPDEPFARQLARGFGALRFDAPLERDYRAMVVDEQRSSALICAIVALAIWGGFAVFDFVRLSVADLGSIAPDLWLLLGARWLVLLVLAAYVAIPLRDRVPLAQGAFAIYALIGIVVALTAAIYKANNLPSADAAQIVVVMAAFLPIGMTFYLSLTAAVLLVVATVVAGLAWLEPPDLAGHMGLALVTALAVPVAAVGAYLREYSHRRQFLLGSILARQAQFDPLTDLANRRLFQRHAGAAIAHAQRNDEQVVLAVVDIDFFKLFNDRNGHAAGDGALQLVAEQIGDAARRPMDMAARLGGEEFALLLYGCDIQRARSILDDLRGKISELLSDDNRLTVSIGASAPLAGEDLAALYDRADRLLYASKAGGRNRLSIG